MEELNWMYETCGYSPEGKPYEGCKIAYLESKTPRFNFIDDKGAIPIHDMVKLHVYDNGGCVLSWGTNEVKRFETPEQMAAWAKNYLEQLDLKRAGKPVRGVNFRKSP